MTWVGLFGSVLGSGGGSSPMRSGLTCVSRRVWSAVWSLRVWAVAGGVGLNACVSYGEKGRPDLGAGGAPPVVVVVVCASVGLENSVETMIGLAIASTG